MNAALKLQTASVASASLLLAAFPVSAASPEAVVMGFMRDVRSGRHPDLAGAYMAPVVQAHQVASEGDRTIERTPQEYAEHVREFLTLFGDFRFEIEECFAAGDKVYVRWRQTGQHLASFDGEQPTRAPLVEISSAVYRVRRGQIVEYWIQVDRLGLQLQLERAERQPGAAQ